MIRDELDQALEMLRGAGPQAIRGMDPNHGPMVVEALVALGRASVAPSWAEHYRRRLGTMPAATRPVTIATSREAFGMEARFPDWVAFFAQQLEETTWQKVLEQWLPRLVPAIVSAGTHGLIRTAHAARALSRGATPLRVEELGVGLAYWCAYYGPLADSPEMTGNLDLPSAIANVPRIMRGRNRTGIPRRFVYEMSGKEELINAIRAASEPQSVTAAIGTFSEAGARLYLANRSRFPLIFIHTVTAPAALRLLLPHMTPATRRTALAYLWQSLAAMIAAYGEDSDAVDSFLDSPPSTTWAELVDRCIDDGDPHSIKFVEASQRESQVRPSAAYMAAVLDWSNRRRSARSWNQDQHRVAGMTFG